MKRPDVFSLNPISRRIYRLLYRLNKNFLAIVVGPTGSGKSWAALRFAWLHDRDSNGNPRFNIDRIVFSAEEFINLIKNEKLPKGSFVIWDEAGVHLNARNWYDLKNKMISYITQTFRYRNLGVLYTVPSFNYVDAQIRPLFHAQITMQSINHNDKTSKAKFEWIDANPNTGDIYKKKPRIYDQNGQRWVINKMNMQMPPQDLIDAYEKKKAKVLRNWYEGYSEEVKKMKEILGEAGGDKTDINRLYDSYLKDPERYLDTKGKVSAVMLMTGLNIGRTAAYDLVKYIRIQEKRIEEAGV